MKNSNAWSKYSHKQDKNMEDFIDGYLEFLSQGKTERECINQIISKAEKEGFTDLEKIIEEHKQIKSGDKVYVYYMGKIAALFVIGSKAFEEGIAVIASHIDSPRLDVKQNPLYENDGLAFLDTHYYGGIKNYQWVNIPLSIHGVVVKQDGQVIQINIGESNKDPVFCILDLPIQLARKQMEKSASDVVDAEDLDLLLGSKPTDDSYNDLVKENVIHILKQKYEICEEDFQSAELEIVPAGMAREAGLDSSFIMGYGQDDKACVYASLTSITEIDSVKNSICCIFSDKEEIGSVGATGLTSAFLENAIAEIMNCMEEYSELKLRRCLKNSYMISADTTIAYEPLHKPLFDTKNSAYSGCGIVINKFTGIMGKAKANDANAEYVAKLKKIFNQENVSYQLAEMGAVDAGGGSTMSYIMSKYGSNVIDCGIAVFSMHAPWEITNKVDVYEAQKGYTAFFKYIFEQ